MPRPMYRTRSWRRIVRRIPSGEVVVKYEKRKPGRAKCAICGADLNGVPILRPSKLVKLAKSEKRPQRPYGGYLCPNCLSRGIREAIRSMDESTR
ncbi:MAG: 50S ribosomal protein L34e [Desulfurococcaceae archaeon]